MLMHKINVLLYVQDDSFILWIKLSGNFDLYSIDADKWKFVFGRNNSAVQSMSSTVCAPKYKVHVTIFDFMAGYRYICRVVSIFLIRGLQNH